MRLILSVAVPGAEPLVDVVAECASGARVADLATALAGAVRFEQPSVVPRGSGHLGVVQVTRAALDVAVPLWWRGRELEPDQELAASPLRHGHLVGLGRDVPDPWDEPYGVCEIRVVSGRGAGTVHRLAPGHHEVGSSRAASIRLDDEPERAVSLDVGIDGSVVVAVDGALVGRTVPAPRRMHPLEGPIVVRSPNAAKAAGPPRKSRRYAARLEQARGATAGIEELDPEQDRPYVHLGRLPLTSERTWTTGASLVVGDTVLELADHEPPDASLSPSAEGATLDFNRPPRLLPPVRTHEFRLPAEPRSPDKQAFPLAMMVLPVLMGGAMYYFTKSPYSLIIMALSPAMAISNWVSSRKSRRGQHVDAVKSFTERTARVEADAYAALTTESAARRRELPDPATVLLFATGPRSRLWERRRTDPDWMLARVGTADVPSEVSLRDPAREDHERLQHWTAADVPVAVPLARVGVTGVAGSDHDRRRVAGWMVAQVAASHSPADVTVVLLAEPEAEADWRWVRWLPHLRRDAGPLVSVGNDDESTARRIAELLDLVERRREAASGSGGSFSTLTTLLPPPVLVVLDGARRIRLLPGLVTLLREGPAVGVLFLCLDEQERQLPEECQAVVRLTPGGASVSVTGRDPVEGVRADVVDAPWLERLARALSPIRDISTEDLASTLPSSSRLLDVLHLDPPQAQAVAQGWAEGGRTTKAVIGETGDGLFTVDVSADGPHGLVAGTTGSGKSELLQTLIASLAVGNRPDEMTFVLVDYKGGAAFKDCKNLPHTVGMVTDLDTHLTTRALESLAAELRRREHQLAGAGAKDIEDYLAARGPHDDPMPRLLIVIDEFAALVAELPDFVTGLVDIARRGRSLGVHLLLATQRPAGVVSAEIKSNTNLRIALRVTDRNDSQDVIEGPEAAEIAQSLPGRAYARLGHSSLVAFQASRVGGRPPSASRGGAVAVAPLGWGGLGRALQAPGGPGGEDDIDTPTDLAALVTAVQGAAEQSGVAAPPPPWLPALPAAVTLDDLAEQSGRELPTSPFALPYGLVDLPSQQRRDIAVHDIAVSGHLAVVGAPRSGRSTTLRAIAAAVGLRTSPRDVHVYGVDCGNNALLPLVGLPHTGAVVSRDQPERLARLTRRLRTEISRRQRLLAEQSYADVTEQRASVDADERLPYILVLLDRWEGFIQAFEDYDSGVLIDLWTQILQEGPGAGVKVVLSGDRSTLVGRISTLTEDRVMLRMPDAGDYSAVGMSPRQVPGDMADGRAFRSTGSQEVQVCVLDREVGGAEQVAALQRIARDATARAADRGAAPATQVPFRVDDLPTRITLAEARALGEAQLAHAAVPAGVGGDSLTLFGLEAEEHGPGALVVGPRRSGRSTALVTMGLSALERGWAVATVTPRRSPLRELSGLVGELTLESTRDEVKAVLAQLVPGDGPPTLLLIDDLELLGTDGALADAVVEHLAALRDRPGLIVAGGTTDELSGSYRGPAPALKKSRSGLLLAPASPNDGDVFGLRLPRSVIGAAMPGRGILSLAGAWQSVQVPVP